MHQFLPLFNKTLFPHKAPPASTDCYSQMLRMSKSHGAFHSYDILDVDILFSFLAYLLLFLSFLDTN